ncbi:MAG: response regulator transcription factor [Clostridia bacterium]|nr:response regulator transcription factor [Clostridia bacterium]
MGKTDGIQLAQALRDEGSRAALIYTTSSRDHAIDGYKVQANDYLLKPIEKDTLDASIGRVLKRYDNLLVETDGMLKSIPISEIRYAKASANYVILRTANHAEMARLRSTLSEALKKLGEERFARCHKGYLVNLGQVHEVRTAHILLYDGSTIPLGRQHRTDLQKNILDYVEKAITR